MTSTRWPTPWSCWPPVAGRGRAAGGLASVHDSGAERALVVDVADAIGLPFAPIGDDTRRRLVAVLDPGLVP